MLSEIITNIAEEVFNALGCGHSESIYHSAMEAELRLRNIQYQSKLVLPIYYKGFSVGRCEPDIIIDDFENQSIIIELKSITRLNDSVHHQLDAYLRHTGYTNGIMINFSAKGVESKVILNSIE